MKAPKFTHGFVDRHGKPRFYLRRPGHKQIPLPGLPWSPEFMAAYAAAMEDRPLEIGAKRIVPGTVRDGITRYFTSAAFTDRLAPSTRGKRRRVLEIFAEKHGDKRLGTLRPENVAQMLGKLSPHSQKNWLKALRGLIAYALKERLIHADPTAGYKLDRPAKSDGYKTWMEADIVAFEARWPIGTQERLAFALALHLGQRGRSDICRLGWQNVRNGAVHVKQQKTGAELAIPVHPELARVLAATPKTNMTFLIGETGRPMASSTFGTFFGRAVKEAGLTGLAAHGLRKACCRRLAEAGCTEKQIASISGHATLSEITRYTKAADQARLARQAMAAVQAAFPEEETGT